MEEHLHMEENVTGIKKENVTGRKWHESHEL